MPLHISEIGVHIAIGDGAATAAGSPAPGAERDDGREGAMTPERVEALVRACVADTLRTLRLREER